MRVDDLRRALETVAADAPPARSDVGDTLRRGRRLVATRRLAVSAVALAALGGVVGVSVGVNSHRSVIVEPTPATAPTTTTSSTPSSTPAETTMPSRQFPGFVTAEMKRTVEVDLPSEHFKPSGKFATARDGEYGVLQAAIGIRAPTADGKGQLVFFFHDHVFIGWDADQEALSVFRIEEAGVGAFKVTYANQAAGDGAIGASLPPAVIIYTWNGRRFVSDKTPPPGVYGLNDPTANAIHVKLTG